MIYLYSFNTNLVQRSLFLAICCFFFSCSKKDESLKQADSFSYEVDCSNCEIVYTDQSNTTKKLFHQQGTWSYAFGANINFELKLSVNTTSSQQAIQAYVLKNNEVVFGDKGYNSASISYDTKKATGTAKYGAQQNNGNTGNNNGNNGGSTAPTSSVCGAKNKTGGYCKRKVSGGGYCWQHR